MRVGRQPESTASVQMFGHGFEIVGAESNHVAHGTNVFDGFGLGFFEIDAFRGSVHGFGVLHEGVEPCGPFGDKLAEFG